MALNQQDNQAVYVLHTYPFKETSLLVELFTQTYGRVTTVAKGARRPRSAMRGMLQTFQKLSATWSGKAELKNLHSLEWADSLVDLPGESLMCGFYLNELLLRLLPREDPHEQLFAYYQDTIKALSQAADTATVLRCFELNLLQELGYAVPLTADENGEVIDADRQYRYEAEYGACELSATKNGVQLQGQTLLDMARGDYSAVQTQAQSKQLMRYLLTHYLGDKPLHTRQLLMDLQEL
ncbi:MAG TPA: DNA repair protein RecO [Methylophilus sp.]|nr:DNA repair protein RecO [Methylophilus sp.]HQQ33553.1 DNA repair protein RecO [Methylophilus sp.]